MFLSLEDAKQQAAEQTKQAWQDKKNQNYEIVSRGDVITLYDPSNVDRKGVCQDMKHFIKNEKGELTELSTEEANKRAKGKPVKLESKYYGNGLTGFKDTNGQIFALKLPQKDSEKVEFLSLEDAKQQAAEQTKQAWQDKKNQNYEIVSRGDVITLYDPSNVDRKGVCQDMKHFIKNEKGELTELSTEEANKRAKGKPVKLESKYYGNGLMGFKDTNGQAFALNLSQQKQNNTNTKTNNNIIAAQMANQLATERR